MTKIRGEEKALLIWQRDIARTAYISGPELVAVDRFTKGENNGFSTRLKKLGIISDADISLLKEAIRETRDKKAPLNSFCAPESLHIELTSRCPLSCPQCYKTKAESELSFARLTEVIEQASEMGVFQIALGGGEPLIYPRIADAIAMISKLGMATSVTTSGYSFDESLLCQLHIAGLNHMQISMNGSNEKIHCISRDGFQHAVNALDILRRSNILFGINWVARADNINDLPQLIELAKSYGAQNINILRYKPSKSENFQEISLSANQFFQLEDTIKKAKGINIKVDSAFSNLLCHMNGYAGAFTGCGAGRRFLALDAEGYYRPCSHVDMKEQSDNLWDLWLHSHNLNKFRSLGEKVGDPCNACKNLNSCGSCRAVVLGQGQDFYDGDSSCPFYTV